IGVRGMNMVLEIVSGEAISYQLSAGACERGGHAVLWVLIGVRPQAFVRGSIAERAVIAES
ncbi:MAG TPA: hypothetical protein VKE70_05090, partial [Candidatus Solibacter sp.]|nr:hypothetical protein [Candidatus Solibacter sp.]